MAMGEPRRNPIGPEHAELGRELRRTRKAAGATMARLNGWSSGHLSNVENGFAMPSRDLVNAYIALGDRRSPILNAYEAARRATEVRRRGNHAPQHRGEELPPLGPESIYHDIRLSYRIDESEHFYVVNQKGVITSLNAIYRIRANREIARYFVNYRVYYADRRATLTVRPGSGCRIVRSEDSVVGAQYNVFELDTPAAPGDRDPATVSFRLEVESDTPTIPLIRCRAEPETGLHKVRIQFAADAAPERIWWFRHPRGPSPTTEPPGQALPPSPAGFYFYEFLGLRDEECGLGWILHVDSQS